ncbi:hypothetical protein A6M23_11635 [Acidithiobacillus thiooxidans]|uniref:Uncharacterized protein n=1 Tax=Acidithiobacillus thiooxidans TaxID=930 RepID=A0A1C2J5X1_ACITH|nr:hypothetical protein A6M23_11635 [Acidithiobacillus thiooxidans]OCX83643.1 hypothetical protein A6P08_10190 [Acidithiobacillus thiooxidans]
MKMVIQFLIFMSKVGVTDIDLLYPLTLVSCVGQRHLFAIRRLRWRSLLDRLSETIDPKILLRAALGITIFNKPW